MSNNGFLAAAGLTGVLLFPLSSVPATHDVQEPFEPEQPFSAAEREAFRQDVERLQQNYYQASPEMRRRWIESVRERRQRLDMQEDQTPMGQPSDARIKPSRASSPELPRSSVVRSPPRERLAD